MPQIVTQCWCYGTQVVWGSDIKYLHRLFINNKSGNYYDFFLPQTHILILFQFSSLNKNAALITPTIIKCNIVN